jgi:cytochrome c biogenesis protein CcdA
MRRAEGKSRQKKTTPPKFNHLTLSPIPAALILFGAQVFDENLREMTGLAFMLGFTLVFYIITLVATFFTAKIKESREIRSLSFPVLSNAALGFLLFGGLNMILGYHTTQGFVWMFIFPTFLFTLTGAVYAILSKPNTKQNQTEQDNPITRP